MSTAELHPAYILHQRPYRDTSLLLEVFSRDHGRFGLVARGVRGPRARSRGLLQPFQPLLLSWGGRGELGSLQKVEADGAPHSLRGANLYSGFYLNELLIRLLQRMDPHPEIYHAYVDALGALNAQPQRALRLFEKRLLDELGYALLLDHEAETGMPLAADACYRYELESGPVQVESASATGLVLKGASLLSLAAEELADAQSLADSKRLMRAALSLYLGERGLKTREVFAALTPGR